MKKKFLFFLCMFFSIVFSYAVEIDHLGTPIFYDNVGNGWGQTFVAQDTVFSGVKVYIRDPTRPDMVSVNELVGPASLLLYDASLSTLSLVASSQIAGSGVSLQGLCTLMMDAPVATIIGRKYMFAFSTADLFGIGLRADYSTYSQGGEAYWNGTTLTESARDLSFAVLSIPEPSMIFLSIIGLFFMICRVVSK